MASLTGKLVAETYKALLKLIDNDILTASEKQITDGFGGGSNVFIDSQGFLRANKYKITNGLATQFLKADGSLDSNAYLTSITGTQVITALGFTPVPTTRTITINGETHNLAADNSWTVGGTAAIWGNITGTLSNQTDLQNALNAKYNNPTGTISQYIRGDGTLATFPTMPGGLPTGGTTGQILAKIDATDYNAHWIDNYATQTKNEVKLGQTLTKGTPVYVSSANGTNMIVSRASNTSEALSSKTFGLLESGGATNDIVKCVTFGLIAGLDTSTAQAGDPVWLGVNGALIFGLANKPYAPAHLVYIGVVTRVQQNNGEIFVNIQNGFELKEIHDVYIADPANNHGLFYDIADGLWKNKSIATALGYTPQAQLSGTGFVKASGTTITYDNSTYLTTTDAASTYQRLDKMVSNLLPSATEYPNSNAVIAALALKADAANPVFTGNMTISGAEPKLYFTDTDQNPDYFIGVDAGFFRVYDQTAGATRFVINLDGNISTGVGKSITAGSFIKDGGTATQFLKADGSVDSTDYATVASLANYLLSATAASTYQTLANLSTDLTASVTKYPSVNAVNAGLATKQPLDADLTAIAGLTGTSGFLKKTAADTWTLDTSTYLTTGDASTTYLAITTAASTYQRLDKMVSNLLPSSTEYPNSNAVINALALKADAANPVFTGNMTISGAEPTLYFTDTDQNPDYKVFVDAGYFKIYDQTAGATRFQINSDGNISAGIGKSITASSFIGDVTGSAGSVAWSGVTGKPTTLSGYGITDAVQAYYNTDVATTATGDWISMTQNSGISSQWTHILNMAWSRTSQANWVSQIAFVAEAGTGAYYRTTSGAISSASWIRFLDASNYGSYALPLTGGTLTGKLQINANWGGTNPERFTIRGTYPSITLRSTNNDNNWLIHNDGNLSFYYATGVDSDTWGRRMYLDSSGTLRLMDNIVLTAGNYTSYAPSLTGYGASGTWGIDISGASNRTYRGIIQDTRSGQRTPNDYEDYRVSWEFTNQIVSGWHSVMTMQGWHDGYAAWQIIGWSDGGTSDNWYLRSGNNTTWGSLRTIIHSGNIGAQSVTYADNAGAVGTVGESRIVYGENSTATTSISNATLDGALKSGFYTVGSGGIPNATGVNFVLHTAYAGVGNLAGFDLACNDSTTSQFYLRPATGGGKGAWQTIITSATIGSQSVSYSSTAGLLNALGSYVWNAATAASSYHQGISASFVSSNEGWPSYGSVMTVKTYSGSMGSLQLYTPYSPTYGGYRLRYRSSNYDTGTWDGWKDLLNSVNDPYAYNMNQYVRTSDTPTFQDVYTNGWFRNNANNAGLYSQANNVHFYSTSDGYWNMGGGGRANNGLVFRQDHQTTIKGYVYWDGDGFGLLNNQGGWSVRAFQGTGYGGELRGTWYTGDLIVGTGGSSTITMKDSDEGNREIHCNSNRIGFLNQSSSWGAWCNDDGSWEATTMYSYNGLVNNQAVSTNTTFGMYFDSGMSTAYAIYREAGGWSYPYPDLRIAFHTGISLGANPSYGGVRFFSDYDMSTVVLYVNNASYGGAGNVYAVGSVSASAFYETSDMRLKKLIDGSAQIEGIENLEAKLYEKDGKIELGYFAQDAELIMPNAITKNADGFMNLSYREVHTAKIARLEKEVAELKAQLNLN